MRDLIKKLEEAVASGSDIISIFGNTRKFDVATWSVFDWVKANMIDSSPGVYDWSDLVELLKAISGVDPASRVEMSIHDNQGLNQIHVKSLAQSKFFKRNAGSQYLIPRDGSPIVTIDFGTDGHFWIHRRDNWKSTSMVYGATWDGSSGEEPLESISSMEDLAQYILTHPRYRKGRLEILDDRLVARDERGRIQYVMVDSERL